MMSEEEIRIHLAMGEAAGKDATCGPPGKPKVNYKREDAAVSAAARLSDKYARDLEGYPCFFCERWHVGRAMIQEEWYHWSSVVNEKQCGMG